MKLKRKKLSEQNYAYKAGNQEVRLFNVGRSDNAEWIAVYLVDGGYKYHLTNASKRYSYSAAVRLVKKKLL